MLRLIVLLVPGSKKPLVEKEPEDHGHDAGHGVHDLVGGATFSVCGMEVRREVKMVELFEKLQAGWYVLALPLDGIPNPLNCGFIQTPERPGAVAQQVRMLAKQ